MRTTPDQTAVERAMHLFCNVPRKDLPTLAMEFESHLCREVGYCGEVILTAFAVYAQCVEGLPCDDELYKAREKDVEWFAARKAVPHD